LNVLHTVFIGPDDTQKLTDYIASGESPRGAWRVGTEYEKFALGRDGHRLAYEDQGARPGIARLLGDLGQHGGWGAIEEAGSVIGLVRDGASITLEPGGQFELSGAPFETIHETQKELETHLADLRWLSEQHGVRWAWAGLDPVHAPEAIRWMPKARYGVMRSYLPTRGELGLTMMQRTCTVQANLDFESEVDMGRKLRVGMGLASIVTAMFANSPFDQGRPCGMKSFRAHVWTDTDPDRTGLKRWAVDETLATYERWVEFALDVPMFFFMRDGTSIPSAGLPFRRFMSHGHQGHQATMADWELHLSTLFPEARLKTYLEMRSADCVAPELIPALPALWKGILYQGSSLDAAWDLVRRWSFEERLTHRHDAARLALDAPIPGKRYSTADVAVELLDIALAGLANLAKERGHEDERVHLRALELLTRRGRCPADESLAWMAKTPKPERDLIAHYE
jgi:glutamate--cysteine ligase